MKLSRRESNREGQHRVAHGHEPQRRRLALHHVRVVGGELDQREHHRGGGGRGKRWHCPGECQRGQWHHPDQELGREHLSERGKRRHRAKRSQHEDAGLRLRTGVRGPGAPGGPGRHQGHRCDQQSGEQRYHRRRGRMLHTLGPVAVRDIRSAGAQAVEAQQHHGRCALHLRRAVQVVGHGIGGARRRDSGRHAGHCDHDERKGGRGPDGLPAPPVSHQPGEGDREHHDREALRHHRGPQHRQARARPVGHQQEKRRQRERHRREVEVGAQHRAREQGRHGHSQHRAPRVAARTPRQAAHQRHQRRGQHQRQRREGQAIGAVVGARDGGQREQRRGQRRILEGHVAVGQRAVEEEVGVGAVQEEVGHALVTPRSGEERDREGPGQSHERERPHAGAGSDSKDGRDEAWA